MAAQHTPEQAADLVRRLKRHPSDEERLQGWQQARLQQGLSGEFAVSAKLGEQAVTDEQVKWIADMYGR